MKWESVEDAGSARDDPETGMTGTVVVQHRYRQISTRGWSHIQLISRKLGEVYKNLVYWLESPFTIHPIRIDSSGHSTSYTLKKYNELTTIQDFSVLSSLLMHNHLPIFWLTRVFQCGRWIRRLLRTHPDGTDSNFTEERQPIQINNHPVYLQIAVIWEIPSLWKNIIYIKKKRDQQHTRMKHGCILPDYITNLTAPFDDFQHFQYCLSHTEIPSPIMAKPLKAPHLIWYHYTSMLQQ